MTHLLDNGQSFNERKPVKIRQIFVSISLTLMALTANAAEPLVIHVFVALADNKHQGIVPVPASLGDGDNPAQNLYWGAAYGMKTFFSKKAPSWKRVHCRDAVSDSILERCVFTTREPPSAFLVADAYRGRAINEAMTDFMSSASGKLTLIESNLVHAPNSAALSVYVGHNGLMDTSSKTVVQAFPSGNKQEKQAVVLACKSQMYFAEHLERSGARSLVLTYDFMAPEAYVVEGIVEGFRRNETAKQIRIRAAKAYARYQKIPEKSARSMFGAPKL